MRVAGFRREPYSQWASNRFEVHLFDVDEFSTESDFDRTVASHIGHHFANVGHELTPLGTETSCRIRRADALAGFHAHQEPEDLITNVVVAGRLVFHPSCFHRARRLGLSLDSKACGL